MNIRRGSRLQIGAAVIAGLAGLLAQSGSAMAINPNAAGTGLMASEIGFNPSVPAAVHTSPTVSVSPTNGVALTWNILADRGSQAAYVDDVGLFYEGPATINASGSSPFESVSTGSGSFTANVTGTNTFGGSISCPAIGVPNPGSYIRFGVVVEFAAGAGQGTCFVDGQPVSVQFIGTGLFQTDDYSVTMGNPPSSLPGEQCPYGNGVSSDVSRIVFDGTWVVQG